MTNRVHLVGIAGAGMSAIARILFERGEKVSGSDRAKSPYSIALEKDGVTVIYGHRAENVAGANLVIASSAVSESNVELQAARSAGIPVLRRSEFLGQLTSEYRTIAVAGTHGKTTTSGLIAWILNQAGFNPSFIVGGMQKNFGTNAQAGSGRDFVIEADEYDRTFLGLHPNVAVVTTVEHDHPDCYPTREDYQKAFEAFANQVNELLVVCYDNPGAAALHPSVPTRLTYGLASEADWRGEDIRPNQAGGVDFLVQRQGELLGLVRGRLPGNHNVCNMLAALAVSDYLGVPFGVARNALVEFRGTVRRFEVLGEVNGVTVIDDYAHHPTEIRATLAAARSRYPQADIWAVFQPHTYSRLRKFIDGFAEAFVDADHVVVAEVFSAREKIDPAFGGRQLAERIQHPDVEFIDDLEETARNLLDKVKPGSLVITLSAGDGNKVGILLLRWLQEKRMETDEE